MTTDQTLTITASGERELVMKRAFNAPRDLVFEAFTKPELLKRWLLGPPGWEMIVCDVDFRVGGAYRYVWRHADGKEMGMGGVYREIEAPVRVVHTEKFDEPWYPGEAWLTTVFAEHADRTSITVTIRYESKATRDAVLKSPMETGVRASYDRLADLLVAQLAGSVRKGA